MPVMYFFHFLEELALGFYTFVNPNATWVQFVIANSFIFAVYFVLLILFTLQTTKMNAFFVLTLSAAAQFFNAFYHTFWTFVLMKYCPGMVTGLLIYVPFFIMLLWIAYRDEYVNRNTAIGVVALGFTLMTLFEIRGVQSIVLFGSAGVVVVANIYYYIKNK